MVLRSVYEVESYFMQLDGEIVFTVLGAILCVITGAVAIDMMGVVITLDPSGAIRMKGNGTGQYQFCSFGEALA